jgi:hypothetical protein
MLQGHNESTAPLQSKADDAVNIERKLSDLRPEHILDLQTSQEEEEEEEEEETGPRIAVIISKVDGSILELSFAENKNPTVLSVGSEIDRREGCGVSSQELYFMGDDSERQLPLAASLAQILANAKPPVEILEFFLLINPLNEVSCFNLFSHPSIDPLLLARSTLS